MTDPIPITPIPTPIPTPTNITVNWDVLKEKFKIPHTVYNPKILYNLKIDLIVKILYND